MEYSDLLYEMVKQLEKEVLFMRNPGLIYGKMGIAIFFFKYARYSGNYLYEDAAMQIIDSILEKLEETTPVDYASGLEGIGVGLEYLMQNSFIEADSNEVLQEMDDRIIHVVHARLVNNASLENGVCGIGRYLVYRIKGRQAGDDNLQTLLNKEYLIYLIDWLEELFPVSTEYLKDIQDLLCEIFLLGIYITKVEELLEKCIEQLQGNNWGMRNGKAGIGFSLLTTSVPW